jgi:hypothetical protein
MASGGVARPRLRGLKNKSPPLAGRQFQAIIVFVTGCGVKSLEKPHDRPARRDIVKAGQIQRFAKAC